MEFSLARFLDSRPADRSSVRLQAFSDAVFSIISTVMILPISHIEFNKSGSDLFFEVLPKVVIFIFSFMLVCSAWNMHLWIFQVIQRVDEFIVLLNLAILLFASFLPYSFTLLSRFVFYSFSQILFYGLFFVIEISYIIILIYVFYKSSLLVEEIRDDPHKLKVRNRMLAIMIFRICFFSLATVFSLTKYYTLSIITIFLTQFVEFLIIRILEILKKLKINCLKCLEDTEVFQTDLLKKLFRAPLSSERFETFSDGVFAIVSTLIILDLCEYNIPNDDEVKNPDELIYALGKYSSNFQAFAGVFITTALLWYIHHTLFHYLKKLSRSMVILNRFSLVFVGLFPMIFKFMSSEIQNDLFSSDEKILIRFSLSFLFFASFSMCLIWIVALFNPVDSYLTSDAHYFGSDHWYLLFKLLLYPVICVVLFFASYLHDNIGIYVFMLMQLFTPLIFFLLYLFFLYGNVIFVCLTRMCRRSRNTPAFIESDELHYSNTPT